MIGPWARDGLGAWCSSAAGVNRGGFEAVAACPFKKAAMRPLCTARARAENEGEFAAPPPVRDLTGRRSIRSATQNAQRRLGLN